MNEGNGTTSEEALVRRLLKIERDLRYVTVVSLAALFVLLLLLVRLFL
jgi:hypothetical protein